MELWTLEHFIAIVPAMIVGIIVAFILRKFLINKPLNIRMIPFQVGAVILLVLEVIKQILSVDSDGYNLYSIPLHVCSLFLYLFPLVAFYKGKHSDLIKTLACTVSAALTVFMFVYPALIFSADNVKNFAVNYLDFHTVFFHVFLLFMFVLIFALELHTPQKKSYLKEVTIFGLGYSVVAASFSQILKTNFSNFYSCNVGPIGDFVNSMKESMGYGVAQTIYVLVLVILHIGFFIGVYYLYMLLQKLASKLTNKKEIE